MLKSCAFVGLLLITLVNSDHVVRHFIVDLEGTIDSCQTIAYIMNAYHRREIDVDFVITPSWGSVQQSINNVVRCFEVLRMSRNVSIYLGSDNTLSTDVGYLPHYGNDGFGNLYLSEPNKNYLRKTKAPVRIAEIVADSSKEYTYVAIGSLTNLAIAMTMYNHVAENIKNIHVIGGHFEVGLGKEAYFYADPEAVNIVLKKAKTKIQLLTLTNCMVHTLDYNWRKSVNIDNPYFNLIDRAERNIYLSETNRPYSVCGAYLVSTAIEHGNVKSSEPMAVTYNLCTDRGYLAEVDYKPEANVDIIKINEEKYKEFFIREFTDICYNYDCSDKYNI